MFKRHFIIITLCILTIIGCGRFDNEYTSVVSSDEVSDIRVSCVNFLGVPTMCAVINQTTKTIRIETLVTNIVDRIVEKEVITEVPIEQIVKRVETRYIVTGKKIDIEEIVKYIIGRIKEHVQPDDLIDVPTDVIVDETTETITDTPPPDNTTTLGEIRDENPTPPTPTGNDEEETVTPPSTVDDEEETVTPPGPTQESVERLRVIIGPKTMESKLELDNQGLTYSLECNIDGAIVYPSLSSVSTTSGQTDNAWAVQFWCDAPEGIDTAAITVNIDAIDSRWCELTSGDVSVEKFVKGGGSFTNVGPMAATINLAFGPLCNTPPMFDSDEVYRYVDENTPSGEAIGEPVSATDEDIDDTLTYTLGGANAAAFIIDSSTGQLRVHIALDHENKPNYGVVVTASDNRGGTAEIRVRISVNDLNEAPVFTEGETAARCVVEGISPGNFGNPVKAIDEDLDDTLTYTLSGTDAASFSINSSGKLRTVATLDYDTQSSYSITVTASDTAGLTDTIAVTINVAETKEFFEVHYGFLIADDVIEVRCYTVRGYWLDEANPVYSYNHLCDSSVSTGESELNSDKVNTWQATLEDILYEDYGENAPDYIYGKTSKVSLDDNTVDEARKKLYEEICSASKANSETWVSIGEVAISFAEINYNVSSDVFDYEAIDDIKEYLLDDDCNPDN